MNVKYICLINLLAACIAILLTFFGYDMPDKRLKLFPIDKKVITLYSDEGWGGQTSVAWINNESKHWQCNLAQSEFSPVCGMAAEIEGIDSALDLSKYTALAIKLKYVGEASKLRIYLRNHNPAYSTPEDPDSFKFNYVNIPANEFAESETIIYLSEFSVETWWIEERNIPRKLAHPELDRVVSLGIDYPYPHTLGEHSIQIESIEAIGPLFYKESYFMLVGCILAGLIVFESLLILSCLKRKQQNQQEQASLYTTAPPNTLVIPTQDLESSKQNDLTLKITEAVNTTQHPENTCLTLLKINQLGDIADYDNKDEANRLLESIHALISNELKPNDTLTRWGEEEFLILSTASSKSKALKLTAKIHKTINGHKFNVKSESKIEVYTGGTSIKEGDDFATAFMRAEQALYKASTKADNTCWLDG